MSSVETPRSTRPANLGDWADARAGWRLDVPERFNAVVDIIEKWAGEQPEAPALVTIDAAGAESSRHSIGELAALTRRMGRTLLDRGVLPGDAVFVMLPRVAEWYITVLGAIRIGAVPMPGPNLLTPKDIAFRVECSGAVAAVTDAAGAAKVNEVAGTLPTLRTRLRLGAGSAPTSGWEDFGQALAKTGDDGLDARPTHRDDPMFLYFTSGTVSLPKMVLHSQSYGLGHVTTARFWHDLRAGDLHWTVTDSGWAKAAYGGLFGQWHERATVMQVQLARPTPEMVLGILRRHAVTSFCAPPTLYRTLVQADTPSLFDLPALQHCTSAGEPLNPEVIRAWKERTGLTVYDGYGQTEMVIVAANFPGMPVRPGSMGRPMPGWQVEVLDEHHRPVEPGVVGEVCARIEPRPIGLFSRYEGDPEATAAVFRDGWYHTGDKATRDDDGYLWFEGRNDDVITSSAYRIGPFEVESALLEHPAVVEAAVVGRDDPDRTQVVCAFCILTAGTVPTPALAEELKAFVKRTTAPYKYPREVHFVTELPKTISGKIRRSELRARLADGEFPVGGSGPGDDERPTT